MKAGGVWRCGRWWQAGVQRCLPRTASARVKQVGEVRRGSTLQATRKASAHTGFTTARDPERELA